jgi:hypothetical protein
MNIQSVKAVSTTPLFDIKAALEHPEVRGVARILARAGIAKPTARIPHSHLESCMAEAGISPEERMRCKIALDRAHLIVWAA